MQLAMKRLLFGLKRYLRTVDKQEPEIFSMYEELLRYLERAIISVEIYAKQYTRYLEIYKLDTTELTT